MPTFIARRSRRLLGMALVGFGWFSVAFGLSPGTARLPDGRILLLQPVEAGWELRHSNNVHPRTTADFIEPLPFFGATGALSGKLPSEVALTTDAGKAIIFFVRDGQLQRAHTSLPVTAQSVWQITVHPLPGKVQFCFISAAPNGEPALLVWQHLPHATGSILYRATMSRDQWQLQELVRTPDYVAGADAYLDAEAHLHVTWSEAAPEQPVRYCRFDSNGKPLGSPLTLLDGGQQPTLIEQRGQILLAAESPGKGGVLVRWLREGKVERTVMLDGMMALRPQFSRDGHGIAWLFALDRDRRALRYRRLLGHDFSPEATAYGVQGRWEHNLDYSAPRQLVAGVPGFDLVHAEDLPEGGEARVRFDRLPVPTLAARDSRRVLFLDLLDVAELENTVQRVGVAEKSDANPLALAGPPGSADEAWVGYANVLHEEGKFRMWYTGNTNTFERNWNMAYAESADGIHWMKPELGLVPFNGSKANNLLFPNFTDPAKPPMGSNSVGGFLLRDDAEADTARRYKMIFLSSTFEGGGNEATVYLSTSPDGLHWNLKLERLWGKSEGKNQVIRGQTPWVEPLSSFFRDPLDPRDDYRWKLYGIDAYAGHPHMDVNAARSVGLVHGPSAEDLYPYSENPVLDPRTGVDEDQNHGGLVEIYEGMYVSIYQHWSGPDWAVDLRLAASRDGLHFTRIIPDQPLVPRGAVGAWDSGMLCTPNSLVSVEDKLWLYYRGSVGTLATGRALSRSNYPAAKNLPEPWHLYTGLAKLRRDGFAYLTVPPFERAEEGKRFNFITDYQMAPEARVRSIPIEATGLATRTLHANIGSFAPQFAWVKAQLLDAATGQTLPGYGFEDCTPLKRDSLDHTFDWRGVKNLPALDAGQHVQVEFRLFGTLESPRLYSFWLQ